MAAVPAEVSPEATEGPEPPALPAFRKGAATPRHGGPTGVPIRSSDGHDVRTRGNESRPGFETPSRESEPPPALSGHFTFSKSNRIVKTRG